MDNKIDKLIALVDKQNEFLGSGSDAHAKDAAELKKQWFNYVLLSLEKANESIDALQNDVYKNNNECYREIVSAKESIRNELNQLKLSYDESLDKLEKRIEKSIDALKVKLDKISAAEIRQELKTEIEKLKSELMGVINKGREELRTKELDPIKTNLTTLMVKVSLFGVAGGILGSGLVAFVLGLFRETIKAYLAG